MAEVQEILRRIGKHWAEGWDGTFSANHDSEDGDAGFWLAAADAQAITVSFAELQLALNPKREVKNTDALDA